MYDSNTTYYVVDYEEGMVIVFDENWNHIMHKNIFRAAKIIPIGNYLLIAGDFSIFLTDKWLNIISKYDSTDRAPYYRGLYFNSTSSQIYVGCYGLPKIYIFSIDLKLLGYFNVSTYPITDLQEYNNKLYALTGNGTLLLIENNAITKKFPLFGTDGLLFDTNGYMISNWGYVYYSSNITDTGIRHSFPYGTSQLVINSKGHFIVVSYKEIAVYYLKK